jgi:hypothetical protein
LRLSLERAVLPSSALWPAVGILPTAGQFSVVLPAFPLATARFSQLSQNGTLLMEVAMRAEDHEQRAQQLEHANAVLGDPASDPDLAPSLIENFWAA